MYFLKFACLPINQNTCICIYTLSTHTYRYYVHINTYYQIHKHVYSHANAIHTRTLENILTHHTSVSELKVTQLCPTLCYPMDGL